MTTYICKCGRTFQKSTEAGTTGFRMPDYGPGHECYGCPFIQKECWRENGKDVDAFACRGSKVLDYQTDAYCCGSLGAALHVRTLDLEFIQMFFKEYLALPGHLDECLYHGMDSAENGRWQYSFGFAANKHGEADRKTLIDRYFRSEGEQPGKLPSGCDRLVRKDVTADQEKEIVLNQIKEAKAVAQGMEAPVETGVKYYHNGLAYFAGKREDNGKYTVFLDDADNPGPDTLTEVATVPDFDTFEEAQNALDGLALKRGFSTECSTNVETPEMEQQTAGSEPDENGDSVPPEEDHPEMEQPAVKTDNNPAESDNENPPSDNDTGDSVNDDAEQPPQSCDWKNASGDDECEPEEENSESKIPAGERVSLRDNAFSSLLDACDSKINAALRVAVETKQSFTFQAKVTFDYRGGVFSIKHETGYQFDPIKVKDKCELAEEIQIVLDEDGNPVIPYDREHQLNFDEIQPGQREYPPSGGTAKVDGKTGIVEDYQEDGREPEDPPTSDDTTNPAVGDDSDPGEKPDELYPCDNFDCPFYAPPDSGDSGCSFYGKVYPSNVSEAVEVYGCTRPEVLQAYSEDYQVENEGKENEE